MFNQNAPNSLTVDYVGNGVYACFIDGPNVVEPGREMARCQDAVEMVEMTYNIAGNCQDEFAVHIAPAVEMILMLDQPSFKRSPAPHIDAGRV